MACRTGIKLKIPCITGPVVLPVDVPQKNVLFRSRKIINGGVISDIRYIVYIDPRVYAGIEELHVKKSVGRVVGRINERLRLDGAAYILMGPGRWGSNNIDLGVNITNSDIDNTAVLVEIAREGAAIHLKCPIVQYFFQDLVEGHIIYMPVYPDTPESEFNEVFFEESKNVLAELLPDDKTFCSFIKLIDVQSSGAYTAVVADPQNQSVMCYLTFALKG